MFKLLRKFRNNENGATAIEYGLIGALISISVIAGATQMGNTLGNKFEDTANKVKQVNDKNNSK